MHIHTDASIKLIMKGFKKQARSSTIKTDIYIYMLIVLRTYKFAARNTP